MHDYCKLKQYDADNNKKEMTRLGMFGLHSHNIMYVYCRHNDLPWQLRNTVDNELSKIDLRSDLTKQIRNSHTDILRLREGMLGAQGNVIYETVS